MNITSALGNMKVINYITSATGDEFDWSRAAFVRPFRLRQVQWGQKHNTNVFKPKHKYRPVLQIPERVLEAQRHLSPAFSYYYILNTPSPPAGVSAVSQVYMIITKGTYSHASYHAPPYFYGISQLAHLFNNNI